MENPRPEKVAVVEEVRERVSTSDAVILTDYRGLKVPELAALRVKLAAVGGDYKIYKNTLVRLATRDLDLAELDAMLTGPTAVAFVKGDVAEVAKALKDFAKTSPALILKGGILGTRILTDEDANKLAALEPRSVMLAKFAGLLQAPMQQFAGLLQAPMQQFAGLVKALAEKREAEGDTSGAAATAAPPEAEAPVAEPAGDEAPAAEPADATFGADVSAETPAEAPTAEVPAEVESPTAEALTEAEALAAEAPTEAEAPAAEAPADAAPDEAAAE